MNSIKIPAMPLFHGSKDSLPHISDIFLIYTPHSPAKSISFFPQTALPSPAPVHNPMHEISHLPLSIPYHQPSTFPSFLHPLHLSHEKSPAGTKPTGLPMLKAKICLFALICGGDGENRTPVRKRCHTDFSERSLCLSFRYGQTQTTAVHPILEKFPSQPSRSQASGIPQLAPYSLRRELSEQGLALSC